MSKINKFTGSQNKYSWKDVNIKEYQKEYQGITRQVFIGSEENSNNFHMRYFRLEPGTKSNKESHFHEHGVIILHGRAKVQINDYYFEIGPYDAVFISRNDLHQFTSIGDDPLGFICVINPKDRE